MNRTLKRLVALFLGLCLAAHPCSSQNPRKQDSDLPVLRVSTRLVQVKVIVQDRKGQPATGLTQDDFLLLEDGKPQPIAMFSMEEDRTTAAAGTPFPPDTYSNRIERRAGARNSVTVILLDAINTRFADSVYAKNQVVKFLSQLQSQDRVALYALVAGSVRIIHDFTSDASGLLRMLDRFKATGDFIDRTQTGAVPETGIADLDEWLREASQRMDNFYTNSRVLETTSALEVIANHLARLPGRKNLIWVSGSFPLTIGEDALPTRYSLSPERRTYWREVERAARAVSDANMAIYPVDARGLIGAFGPNPGSFNPRPILGRQINPFPGAPLSAFDSMQVLAQRTGGRAFYNSNDIQGAIREAIDDSRVTYVLGYYPSHGKWDGKFHQIKVKLKTKGNKVRHRTGYFAHEDAPKDETTRKDLVLVAARSPLDATTLGVVVRVEQLPADGKRRVKLILAVDRREITLNEQDRRWVGTLDLLFSQRSPEGLGLFGEHQTLQMNLTQESYEQLIREGITLTRHLHLTPGATQLRVVVRDVPSGAIGSVSIPLPAEPSQGTR